MAGAAAVTPMAVIKGSTDSVFRGDGHWNTHYLTYALTEAEDFV